MTVSQTNAERQRCASKTGKTTLHCRLPQVMTGRGAATALDQASQSRGFDAELHDCLDHILVLHTQYASHLSAYAKDGEAYLARMKGLNAALRRDLRTIQALLTTYLQQAVEAYSLRVRELECRASGLERAENRHAGLKIEVDDLVSDVLQELQTLREDSVKQKTRQHSLLTERKVLQRRVADLDCAVAERDTQISTLKAQAEALSARAEKAERASDQKTTQLADLSVRIEKGSERISRQSEAIKLLQQSKKDLQEQLTWTRESCRVNKKQAERQHFMLFPSLLGKREEPRRSFAPRVLWAAAQNYTETSGRNQGACSTHRCPTPSTPLGDRAAHGAPSPLETRRRMLAEELTDVESKICNMIMDLKA